MIFNLRFWVSPILLFFSLTLFGTGAISETRSEVEIIVSEQIESATHDLVIEAGKQYTLGLADMYERLAKEAYSNFGRLNGLPPTDADRARLQSFFSQKSKHYRNLSKSSSNTSNFISQNAKRIGLVIDVGLAAFDEYMLRQEVDTIRESFPGLNVEDIAFTDVRGIGGSIANGLTFGLFRVNQISFEAYDEIPSDPRKLPSWIAVMERISNSPEGEEYANNPPPPLGYLQYLKIKQDALEKLSNDFGLAIFAEKYSWIDNWEVSDTPGFGTNHSVVPASFISSTSDNEIPPVDEDDSDLTDEDKSDIAEDAETEPSIDTEISAELEPNVFNGFIAGTVGSGSLFTTNVTTQNNGQSPLMSRTTLVTNDGRVSIDARTRILDFGHAAMGSWQQNEASGTLPFFSGATLQSGHWVVGQITMPTEFQQRSDRSGSATYTGQLAGTAFDGSEVDGLINLRASFRNSQISAELQFQQNGTPIANASTDTLSIRETSNGVTYSGNLTVEGGGEGNLSGVFYGDSAQSTGGSWAVANVRNSSNGADGVFLAREGREVQFPDIPSPVVVVPPVPTAPTPPDEHFGYLAGIHNNGDLFSTPSVLRTNQGELQIGSNTIESNDLQVTVNVTDQNYTDNFAPFVGTGRYEYTAWGEWDGANAVGGSFLNSQSPLDQGHWVVGRVTTPAEFNEQRGLRGGASYVGDVLGRTSTGGLVSGDINLNADFQNMSIGGEIVLRNGGSTFVDGTVTDATISPNATFVEFFGSNIVDNGQTVGSLSGVFLGDRAQEVGGEWNVRTLGTDSVNATGVFRAKE